MGTIQLSLEELEILSHSLAKLLRHEALNANVPIRSDGYVLITDLIEYFRCTNKRQTIRLYSNTQVWTEKNILEVVKMDKKKRYKVWDSQTGGLYIRAQQGHSIKDILNDDMMLTRITENNLELFPIFIIHGTTYKNWKQIQHDGYLMSGTRRHIHFATTLNTESGIRSSSSVFLHVNLHEAVQSGYLFYQSGNNVILCGGRDAGGICLINSNNNY